MPATKRLAVVTATRAEYGLLRPVLLKLNADPAFDLQVLVTGAHLCPAYGNTVREVEADGLPIAARLPILQFGTGPTATAETIGYTVKLFADWFAANRPDGVLLLGDRYEIFAVATAAACQRVPICHISGGDVTLGAADEYYRHCITKMAALHFPSCAESAARLVRMGEEPRRVFCVGGLGDENIRTLPKMTLREVGESLALPDADTLAKAPFGIVTFHPETAGGADVAAQCRALCDALGKTLCTTPNLFWLITGSNADEGGALCNAALQAFAAAHPGRALFIPSLGLRRYLSAMAGAAVVVGNSSSGVVETPSFGVPTVNIGKRQAGRAICANVVCCGTTEPEIAAALAQALTPAFARVAKTAKSPYGGGDTSGKIVRVLKAALQTPKLTEPKAFYDGPVPVFDPEAEV